MSVRIAFAVATSAVFCACADTSPLPSVDSVLTKANSKAQDFAQQAVAMQKKLDAQQEQSRATLRKQKQEYELRLQAQSNFSQAISRQNAELQAGNYKLLQMNSELSEHLKSLREKNGQMRMTLQGIGSKVDTAQLFLTDSLKMTDDSNATELEVLIPSTPKPTLDHFLAMTSGHALSLLAVQTKRRADGPEEIVSVLATNLAEIAEAEKEGAAELKAHFLESFQAAELHQAELNATQAVLLEEKANLRERRAQLMAAKDHLEATGKELHERLRALSTFANTIDSVVVSVLRTQTNAANHVAANVSTLIAEANATLQKAPLSPVLASSNKSIASSNKSSASLNTSALVNVSMLVTNASLKSKRVAATTDSKRAADKPKNIHAADSPQNKRAATSVKLSEPRVPAAAKGNSLRKTATTSAQRSPLDVIGDLFKMR